MVRVTDRLRGWVRLFWTPRGWGLARFRIGDRAALTMTLTVLALESWAYASTDPDYYLPDPFRPTVIALLVIMLLTSLLARRPRRVIRQGLFVVAGAALILEAHTRFREAGANRIVFTDDVLLRYHYRPGAVVRVGPNRDEKLTVNSLGLLDEERPIPKPQGVYRVVLLTGSIANDGAIPFEDRFFRRLQAELAGALPDGRKVEVINASCEGYNTVQEVRFLEKVGLRYQPDLVVLGYMLTSAGIQNGGYRRLGNSFFLFRFLPALSLLRTGSRCALFAPFHDGYSFDLIVRSSLERLSLLSRIHGFRTLVGVLPIVEEPDDPVCRRIYDKVERTSREVGLPTARVADAFAGEPAARFSKPGERGDVAHPNVEGHRRIGENLARAVRRLLSE